MWAYLCKLVVAVVDTALKPLRGIEHPNYLKPQDLDSDSSIEDMSQASGSGADRSSRHMQESRGGSVIERKRKRPTEEELLEAHREVKRLTRALNATRDENAGLSKRQQELHYELKESHDATTKATDEVRTLQEHAQQQAGRIAELTRDRNQLVETTRELDACQRRRQEMEALLTVRSAELRDAQQYLGKVDAVSYADVKRMVEALNSQIFQLAAQVVDGFSFEKTRSHPVPELVQACCKRVGEFLGSGLTCVVSTSAHADDTMLVQTMIQAYLSRCISDAVGAWADNLRSSQSGMLSAIHENILKHGKPMHIGSSCIFL